MPTEANPVPVEGKFNNALYTRAILTNDDGTVQVVMPLPNGGIVIPPGGYLMVRFQNVI